MKKLQVLFAAAVVAMGSFPAFAANWVYDAATKTVSDGVWTFSATADTSKKTIVFNTCWGFPEELSTLDLSKPISDGSVSLTLTELGNPFGYSWNNEKDFAETTNGLTLAEVVFPQVGLTKIGASAFAWCPSLTNLVNFLPDSVTSVGQGAFYKLPAHCDVYLNGVMGGTIGRHTFTYSGVTSVHFGPNVGNIGNGSNGQSGFQSSTSITNVTFSILGSGIEITKDAFAITRDTSRPKFPLVLNGVKTIGESGVENVWVSSTVFDYCIDSINSKDVFKNTGCPRFTFRGLPPSSFNISYNQSNNDVTTYVRSRFAEAWSEYAEDGVIAESGTSFRADLMAAAGVTAGRKRPLLLLPVEEIATPQEFVEKITADPDGEFKLTADLDFTGTGYASIPLFIGVLDGQGHTITGVGAQPLFEIIHGIVENLTLDGAVAGANTVIPYAATEVRGVLCNTNAAGTVSNVIISGYTIKPPKFAQASWIGPFAGMALNEAQFIGCVADKSVIVAASNNGYGGGIAGAFKMTGGTAVRGGAFIGCTNNATLYFEQEVYGGSGLGGIVGQIKDMASNKLLIKDCVNNSRIYSTNKGSVIGGIVGAGGGAGEDNIVIANCVNYGEISAKATNGGFNLGGIAGNCHTLTITNCVNYGNVTNEVGKSSLVGGLIGYLTSISKTCVGKILDSANYGDVYAAPDSTGNYVGGLIGKTQFNKDYGPKFYIKNCANYGALAGTYVGEVCAGVKDEKNVYAAGKATPAYPNYKYDNCFFMTTQMHYDWTDTNGWFTEGDGNITAEDEGFDAKVAAKTLSAGAAELGLGAWCRGKVNGKVLPELTALSRDPVRPGLMLLVR